jgi:hypothetical protein
MVLFDGKMIGYCEKMTGLFGGSNHPGVKAGFGSGCF